MDLEELNLGQVCRACKCVTPQMRSLFEGYENPHQSPRIDEMLMACASVQVMCGDGLPSQICQICVEQLKNAFVFKRQCEQIDASFREYAKNVKDNEIKEELQNSEFMESLNTLDNLVNEQSSLEENMPDETPTLVTPKSETDSIQIMDNNQMLLTSGNMYKCKLCDKEYTRLNNLQRHEQSHSKRRVYICRICSKTLTSMRNLKRHLGTHLKKKYPFSCKTCIRGFSRIEHLHKHTPKCTGETVYPCDICNKAFNREDILESHKKMHDNRKLKLPTIENLDNIEDYYYQIDQDVDATFSDHSDVDDCFESQMEITESVDEDKLKEMADFTNHVDESNVSEVVLVGGGDNDKSGSKDNDSSEANRVESMESQKIEDKEEVKEEKVIVSFDEDEDDILEDNNEMADKHSGDSTDSEYLPKNMVKPKANHLKQHVTSHSSIKPFRCTVCKKSFNRRDRLNQHQKIHERQNDHECNICQKPFNRAGHLAKHKASKHGIGEKVMGEKKYECSVCNKGFATEKLRDVHMNGHNGQKEYQCKMCEATFLSKSHHTEHINLHNKLSKNFLCSECGMIFNRNDNLVNHMRRHRGEKPFKCKYCGKGFLRTTDLIVHERYHTGEKTHLCTICGRGFGRGYNLRVHMRIHTGEKPYQCKYCDAAFAQSSYLKSHIRRHTGERFQCDLCTERFIMGYLLTQHKRTVHGLKVVSNKRRLQPVDKQNPDEPPPVTIPLPKPVVLENVMFDALPS